ncbi:hypothetical protein QZH41_004360 [Actinostola sp. cb2023]|nr:hypothetical protein QZH41_004360 [Actinostola sp. cb2023]
MVAEWLKRSSILFVNITESDGMAGVAGGVLNKWLVGDGKSGDVGISGWNDASGDDRAEGGEEASLAILSGLCVSRASLIEDYDHFAALDPDEKIKLYWSVDKPSKTVSFALDAATAGWVGFGISTGQGKMNQADMVIGWVKNGKAFLTHRHGDGHYPKLHDHNDYKLISGEESNGRTILKFSHKIDTCDKQDRKLEERRYDWIFVNSNKFPCSGLFALSDIISSGVPRCIAKKEDLKRWKHLSAIDFQELEDKEVMLLIGVKEQPTLFVPLECKVHADDEPIAIRYSLGWTVIGPVGGKKESKDCSVNFVRTVNYVNTQHEDLMTQDGHSDISETRNLQNLCQSMDVQQDSDYAVDQYKERELQRQILDEQLQHQLERLWKTDFCDSVVGTKVNASVEDKKALEVMERTLKKVNGHYQVALPWRDNPPFLPNNRGMAERRRQLLKKRLLKDENLFDKYKTTMRDYIDKGHAVKVPKEELNLTDRPIWYLPHHPVVHPLKPEKVRIVFDCAAKAKGTSLNQELMQGPDLANQLTGVIIRFRQEPVGVVADVEAMFHQVLVEPKDCDALRFFWWPDGDLSNELEEYRMVKHLFGATSSPSIANFCLKKMAELEQESINFETVDTVNRNMYVDDLMRSTDTTEKAITLVSQLRELLARGGFHLTKWYSNDRQVLATIPECERAKSVVSLDLERLPTESALGLKWNIEDDKFVWEVLDKVMNLVKRKPRTRRGILSVSYSLFDPLGFIAPYIMKAKLILQMLSRKGIGWDDPLAEEDSVQWSRWLEDISKLEEIKIERCFKPKGFGKIKLVELHIFSDASRVGYAAVAFLRLVDDRSRIHCAFIMGKARLAPLREISIPRLELTAAVISVKLSKAIREQLDWTVQRVYYWTDSSSVLKCINNTTKRFHTFESNRLTLIHDGSIPSEWRYVNREDNPADDGSKGLKLDNAIKDDRWLKGPRFLWEDENCWPKMIEIPVMSDDDVEIRKEIQIYTSTVQTSVLTDLILYYSSWWRLKKAVAWLLRCKEHLRVKVQLKGKGDVVDNASVIVRTSRDLTVEELRNAERLILAHVQLVSFPEVVEALSTKKSSDERSTKRTLQRVGASIYQLNPTWDSKERLLRVGGRLVEAPVDDEFKHPIILPYRHPVTDLIIEHYHITVGHMGQESVLSSLREKFWIVKGRSAVRRVNRKCIDCQKRKAKPGEQYMANLPQIRLTPDKPPFTYVGVD